MRLTDGVAEPVEPQLSVLNRLLGVAVATTEVWASPGTPDDAKDQAVVQFAAYLYDMPDAPRGSGYATAFRNSGAQNALEPWKSRGLGVLGDG